MNGTTLLLAAGLYLLFAAPWCLVFVKAGKRWWVALLPVVNLLVVMRIAQRPVWWVLLLFVPLLGIAVWTVVCLDVAERFGHGVPVTIGLVFLPFVFATWLGLGPDPYVRPPVAVPEQTEPSQAGAAEVEAAEPQPAPEPENEPAPEPENGPDQRIGAGE